MVYSGSRPQRPRDLPPERDYIGCDVARPGDRESAFAHIRRRYGRLDLFVSNAGVAPLQRRDILETDEESFDRVLGINKFGASAPGGVVAEHYGMAAAKVAAMVKAAF